MLTIASIIRNSCEDFQIFTQRKRSELELRNFYSVCLHNFENFQFFKFPIMIQRR